MCRLYPSSLNNVLIRDIRFTHKLISLALHFKNSLFLNAFLIVSVAPVKSLYSFNRLIAPHGFASLIFLAIKLALVILALFSSARVIMFSSDIKIASIKLAICVALVNAVLSIKSGIVTSISHVEILLKNFCFTLGLITGANSGLYPSFPISHDLFSLASGKST